jgi:predicted nucleotidyltransferase
VNDALTLETIQNALREKKTYMEQQYKIKEIGVFGSYVHGSQTQRSDIDILVDFHSTISAFAYVRLKIELSDLFGRKVDLVAKQALKPNIGKRILGEVKYV